MAYDVGVKRSVLGVADGPVVSRQAAAAMAEGARLVLGSDVGLATTRVDFPAASRLVLVGLCSPTSDGGTPMYGGLHSAVLPPVTRDGIPRTFRAADSHEKLVVLRPYLTTVSLYTAPMLFAPPLSVVPYRFPAPSMTIPVSTSAV